ncbi:MAG TPA: DUF881 domain-containing protein [Clostridia bacterium]
MKFKMNIAITLVCMILGVIIATQYKSIDMNKQATALQSKRVDELMTDILNERKMNDNLSKRLSELQSRNMELESARGKIDDTTKLLNDELERVRLIAGLTDVKGKGVIITINHDDTSYVSEGNLLSLLNELRASDAQAISVNDERVVATTEVRNAGKYIMVNKKQMVEPFVIKAIADPQKVERALKMIGGVVENLEAYRLSVDIQTSDNVTVSKVNDNGVIIKTDMLTPVK